MKHNIFSAGAVVGMLLLAGCSGQELYGVQKIEPQGSEFRQNLFKGYVGLSEAEYAEGDYKDSDAFAIRARQVGTVSEIPPEEIEARSLPNEHVAEMSAAREKLLGALKAGAAEKNPARAAEAQVMFDCWMQEQEENWQPEDIALCRDGFYAAIDTLTPETPVAISKPKPTAVRFVVYFATDKSFLDGDAQAVVAEAKAAAQKLGAPVVKISGNTDTVGSTDYNLKLSELRAQAVIKVLQAGGTPIKAMMAEAHGETKPAILTADEIDEPRNRRVEIILEP
jgi:outer membrane protein OmpA-like peptidoglycan-associated protein